MSPIGKTLGLGCGALGNAALADAQAADLLACALDLGVRLFDAAPSYGNAEERLGRLLPARRHEVVLSTKLGYGVPGQADWTGPCISAGIDQALARLRTDHLDIALLHSCPRESLWRDDIREALARAKRAGKLRLYGYSGEGEALAAALEIPEFDVVMASLNLCDQRVIDDSLPRLRGRRFLAKRPLANAPWAYAARPVGAYVEPYWERWQAMNLPDFGIAPAELATRFAAWQPGVEAIVLGTAQPAHLREVARWIAAGPLSPEVVDALRQAFQAHGRDWGGQV